MVAPPAVIPAALLAIGVVLAGSLYVLGYHDQYHALLQAWGALPFRTPFLDMHAVTSAIECHRLGFNVYADNPCDVFRRVHGYSPVWLSLSVFPITTAWDAALGSAAVLLFLCALPFLPPGRGLWQIVVITLGTISSVVAYALERANADLLMFMLAMVAVALNRRGRDARAVGYAIVLLAGMLKFYPAVLLVLAVRERLSIAVAVVLVACGVISVWFFLDSDAIMRGIGNIPTTNPFDDNVFAASDLPFGLAQILGLSPRAGMVMLITLILGMLIGAGVLARWDHARAGLQSLTEVEAMFLLAGCVMLVGCFLAAQNSAYRAIYFLFVLPGLTRFAATRRPAGIYPVTLGLVLVIMWNSAILPMVYAVLDWFGVSTLSNGAAHTVIWLLRELAWWCVATSLSALMIRLIRQSRTVRDAGRMIGVTA